MSSDTRTNIVAGVIGAPDSANTQRVATSASSARTASDLAPFSVVRLLASVDTYVRFTNSAGGATTNDMQLVGGFPEVFSIGDNTRVAAILASGTGTLDVTVLA